MTKRIKEIIKNQLAIQDFLFTKGSLEDWELREAVNKIIENIKTTEKLEISQAEQVKIADELVDEFLGLGPLKALLEDPSVTEIMVNGPHKIYVEKDGSMQLADVKFDNEQHLMHIIHKILSPTRRRVDESSPFVDVSLFDGSRVNIIIPPLSLIGPVMTIRKFSLEIKKVEDLIKLGTLNERMGEFLVAGIKAKLNIIFAGATGSGKTTTLNVLSSYIPEDNRVVTIEDTAELRLHQEHVVRLEAKQSNIEGKGEVTIRDLFRNSLRMRPDRIILGEIRSHEALDMLQAICSGHTGSLVVLHANSPFDVISRIETMVLTSGVALPMWAVRKQMASAIDLIVQQEQLMDGSRRITHITEVRGIKNDDIELQDLFTFEIDEIKKDSKIKGHWKCLGIEPLFLGRLKKMGVELSPQVFKKD